jgi:hypothetical protein
MNLVKSAEKNPREVYLAGAQKAAVDFVNNQLPEQFKLKYLHYDIKKDLRQ